MADTVVSRPQAAPPGWRHADQSLVRDFHFRDFDQAIAFVEKVSGAEDHLRRPDMCILDFNHVRLKIENPKHAGVTPAEVRLAAKVNEVIET